MLILAQFEHLIRSVVQQKIPFSEASHRICQRLQAIAEQQPSVYRYYTLQLRRERAAGLATEHRPYLDATRELLAYLNQHPETLLTPNEITCLTKPLKYRLTGNAYLLIPEFERLHPLVPIPTPVALVTFAKDTTSITSEQALSNLTQEPPQCTPQNN